MAKNIKHKKVKGRITTLKAMPYKDQMVYLRKIDNDIFEWLLVFKSEIYSSYLIMRPRKGTTKLSEEEISQVCGLLWAGATSTIDTKLGEKLGKTKKGVVKAFEDSRKSVEGLVN